MSESSTRKALPDTGRDWASLRAEMEAFGEDDADWRNGCTAVYVFHPVVCQNSADRNPK